jgi:CheY-like chemotaxis protein
VIEDDWLIATQIQSCLAAAGFDVTGAAVGPQDALRLARDAPPQLVLMDIRLFRDADGVELAKILWQDLGLRCLFVSGYRCRHGAASRGRQSARLAVEAVYRSRADRDRLERL